MDGRCKIIGNRTYQSTDDSDRWVWKPDQSSDGSKQMVWEAERSNDDWSIKIADIVMIPFGDCCLKLNLEQKIPKILLKNVSVLLKTPFWRSPLLWLAYKILERYHNKG